MALRRAVLGAIAVAVVLAPAGSSARQAEPRLAGPPAALTQYGYVRALTPAGASYRLRFDPALWLTGETANRAAREDGAIGPGETAPNDYYVRNESRRALAYVVPRLARVTVVSLRAGSPRSTPITVAQLATVLRGGRIGLRLYGRGLGFWARIEGDRVVRLDQQYQP